LPIHFSPLHGESGNLIANGRVSAQEMAEIAPSQRGKFAVVDSGDGPPNGAIR
jgi:hypothetical protein